MKTTTAKRRARRWKPRKIATWEVVTAVENIAGIMEPDKALVTLANGKVLEVGAEGVNVFDNATKWNMFWPPIASLTFPKVKTEEVCKR